VEYAYIRGVPIGKGATMSPMAMGLDASHKDDDTEFEDVDWEMCCSAREVSGGFVPFANLDFMRAAMTMRRPRVMEQDQHPLAPALSRCPGCGGENLVSALAGKRTNFFCQDCRVCWHHELERTTRVNPWTCPGCQLATTKECFERFDLSSTCVLS
jgi:hypothetical protein